MENLFTSYELAVIVKEKGFEGQPIAWYFGDKNNPKLTKTIGSWYPDKEICITAPLYQQIVDWLRDQHKIYIIITPFKGKPYPSALFKKTLYDYIIYCDSIPESETPDKFDTFYEALNEAIVEALKII